MSARQEGLQKLDALAARLDLCLASSVPLAAKTEPTATSALVFDDESDEEYLHDGELHDDTSLSSQDDEGLAASDASDSDGDEDEEE